MLNPKLDGSDMVFTGFKDSSAKTLYYGDATNEMLACMVARSPATKLPPDTRFANIADDTARIALSKFVDGMNVLIWCTEQGTFRGSDMFVKAIKGGVLNAKVPAQKKNLIDAVADNLAIDDNTPPTGCEAAVSAHKAWLDFLDSAYTAPHLLAKDVGTEATIEGGQTSCSVILGRALGNYGVPQTYLGTKAGTLIPHLNRLRGQDFMYPITNDNLPRKGDPYFLYHPNPPEFHHAIFGSLASKKEDGTYMINDYSGGQATKDSMTTKNDVGFFQRPMYQDKVPTPPLWPGATAPLIMLGGTDSGGVGEGMVRPVKWFTDMWAFLAKHGSEIKKLKDGL